jgi:hypothetical protein
MNSATPLNELKVFQLPPATGTTGDQTIPCCDGQLVLQVKASWCLSGWHGARFRGAMVGA